MRLLENHVEEAIVQMDKEGCLLTAKSVFVMRDCAAFWLASDDIWKKEMEPEARFSLGRRGLARKAFILGAR